MSARIDVVSGVKKVSAMKPIWLCTAGCQLCNRRTRVLVDVPSVFHAVAPANHVVIPSSFLAEIMMPRQLSDQVRVKRQYCCE
jgi:hypothetical protein